MKIDQEYKFFYIRVPINFVKKSASTDLQHQYVELCALDVHCGCAAAISLFFTMVKNIREIKGKIFKREYSGREEMKTSIRVGLD